MSAVVKPIRPKSTALKVEKGVPVPQKESGAGRKALYPWRNMNVGDSFFVPGKTVYQFTGHLSSAKQATGFTFTQRRVDGGVRVWRIA
jgi:hypothetical protein